MNILNSTLHQNGSFDNIKRTLRCTKSKTRFHLFFLNAKSDVSFLLIRAFKLGHPFCWNATIFQVFSTNKRFNWTELLSIIKIKCCMNGTWYREHDFFFPHLIINPLFLFQATANFLEKERMKSIMEQLDEATSLISAAAHDVDHPGRSSAFLSNSDNTLAIFYNDVSVLESHHAALTFKLTLGKIFSLLKCFLLMTTFWNYNIIFQDPTHIFWKRQRFHKDSFS